MALTEIYVDPSIAADSGAGTIGDPYGDIEYAIEQTTFDTTNGTRVNIKAGTDEVLAAELSAAMADTGTTVAWVPSETAPCVFQGYTSAAGDGGVGGISGGGSVSVYADAAIDYVTFKDLHLHNTGANAVVQMDNYCNIINCEVDNSTGNGIDIDAFGLVDSCYVHNIGGTGILISASGSVAQHNHCENGTNDFDSAIIAGSNAFCYRNIISVDGSSDGIRLADGAGADHNSIFSAAGTGQGIIADSNSLVLSITNNLVEGFSNTGGVGIDLSPSNVGIVRYGGNAVYDCTTAYDAPDFIVYSLGSNETLSASPFTDAAGDDFSPVDTGGVKRGLPP